MRIITMQQQSRFLARCSRSSISTCYNLALPQNGPAIGSLLRHTSTDAIASDPSIVVSYLVDSCGLSPASAVTASKWLHFKTTGRPNLVVTMLRSHGISKAQLPRIIQRYPSILNYCTPEKTLLPKMEFFYGKGISMSDVSKIIVKSPNVLGLSLSKSIIPGFDFFESLFGSGEQIIFLLKNNSSILSHGLRSAIASNVSFLEQIGVSRQNILRGLKYWPCIYTKKLEKFRELADEVEHMGIHPSMFNFIGSLCTIASMTKATWEIKQKAYMQWGLSSEDICSAFMRNPTVMKLSKEKINAVMNLLVNEMGLESSIIIHHPEIFCFSVKKRLAPRCSVIKFLQLNELVGKKFNLHNVFYSTEEMFLKKFVNQFDKESLHLANLYQEALTGL